MGNAGSQPEAALFGWFVDTYDRAQQEAASRIQAAQRGKSTRNNLKRQKSVSAMRNFSRRPDPVKKSWLPWNFKRRASTAPPDAAGFAC